MSFVAGFVTGLRTGGVVERRKGRSHFLEYMERRGYSVVDQSGHQIPLNTIVDEVLKPESHSNKKVLVASAVLVGAVVLTGGSAWALLSIT